MKDKALVVGIGNPIRQDDAIGWHCINLLKNQCRQAKSKLVDYMVVHQLDIIHSEVFAQYSIVIIVDADAQYGQEPVRVEEIKPVPVAQSFTSHIGAVADILALTGQLYGSAPKVFLVAVRGSSFEVEEGLTTVAVNNARAASAAVNSLLNKFLPLG